MPSFNVSYSSRTSPGCTFRIARIKAEVPGLPRQFAGFRIVQLSDLHFGPLTPESHIRDAVEIANSLNPDLIALTGDNVQVSPKGIRHFYLRYLLRAGKPWRKYRKEVRSWAKTLEQILSSLSAEEGVIGVLGNHEYHEGRKTIVHALKSCKTWLINSSTFIERDGAFLKITGVDDSRFGRPDVRSAVDAYKGGITKENLTPAQKNPAFRLLLIHNPDILLQQHHILRDDPYLVLAGHTHGGQIRLPLIGPIVTRTKQRTFIRGLVPFEPSAVFINSGIGWGGIQLRMFCPPEIAVVELQPSDSNSS